MPQDNKQKQGSEQSKKERVQQSEKIERKADITKVSDTEPPPPRRRDGDNNS